MDNFLTATSIFSFLACVLLGVLYAWILYGSNKGLAKSTKNIVAGCRIMAITAIAWLILSPLFKQISYLLEKPIVVVAYDNSISAAEIATAGFDRTKFKNDLQTLVTKLSAAYEVKTYSFSDSVKSGLDFSGKGQLSNGTALIHRLNDELLNRNIGAVVLASDGIFNRGGNPLYELDQLKAPVYTIAMGDPVAKRDVVVVNVNYNNLIYLDDEFTLDVQVQAFESKGETTQLTVAENGKNVSQQNIAINANSFVKDVSVKLKANKVGIHKYTINLAALPNEVTTKNNTQTLFIEVIDAKHKILLAAATPHPDLAVFKQAIERQKHYEVVLALADDLNGVELDKYSLVVLYQLPNQLNMAAGLFKKLQNHPIPLWYIVGAQSNLTGFNQMQNLLSLSGANGALQEVFPYLDASFTTFNLAATAAKQLNNYDPLLFPFANLAIKGSYTAVLNQRIGKINTQSPLLFFMNQNGKKTGFLLGEGIWKWKLEEAKSEDQYPLVDELIAKAVQYFSVKDDKRKFKVYSNKGMYEENEHVIINATLYNDSYVPVNDPEVQLVIKNEAGKLFNYTLSKLGKGYSIDVGTLAAGNYTYVANTKLGEQNHKAMGAFYVNALIAEYQQTTANHQLLYTMAAQHNGESFLPHRLLEIEAALQKNQQLKTISYEERKYVALINMKWLFVLILVLLTSEWLIRKRNGEI